MPRRMRPIESPPRADVDELVTRVIVERLRRPDMASLGALVIVARKCVSLNPKL